MLRGVLARFGDRGRLHVARDAAWHLEHLDEAIAAGEPRGFADYADWLAGLLEARGIGREHVAGVFGFLADGMESVECLKRHKADRKALVVMLRDNRARIQSGSGGSGATGSQG